MRGQAVLVVRRLLIASTVLLAAAVAGAQQLVINDDHPVYSEGVPFQITGSAAARALVTITVEKSGNGQTQADANGSWTLIWTAPVKTGTWTITATSGGETATQLLRVQLPSNLQRQSGIEAPPRYANPEIPHPESYQEMTDRWRITPPPYELTESPHGRAIGKNGATTDPYNQNLLKGDLPIFGKNWFLDFTGISDTLAETRTLPTPSGVSAVKPTSFPFFGKDNQNLFNQNIILSFDLFQGDTAFKPITQRLKLTVIANLNSVHVSENGIVKPDVARGTTRTDGYGSIQELFYERKLKDVSPNYDFISIRVGSQPFNSDFRGFIFNDTNLGIRVFGNFASNRYQWNVAAFDEREKDTNSGLNTFERRGEQVGIANIYMQDFVFKGYTQEFSIHYVRDEPSLHYDKNGDLVRPAPVGVFTPHEIRATYVGEAGLGHIGRFNVDHAVYYVFGKDDLNPIAGPDPQLRDGNAVHVSAGSAALEVSYDHDWFRPRIGFFYASGDANPRDRNAHGFDSILDSTAFAGGGFSFFDRLGIQLTGTGVGIKQRGSLLFDLRSSKDEGQLSFVNPGVQLITAGVDIDVTPKLKAILTGNYIRLDHPESVSAILFQDIHKSFGTDVSVGLRYRPFLNQNFVIVGGTAAFLPGAGFKDIYERDSTLYHVFTNVILTF
jgi:hypothetical protein